MSGARTSTAGRPNWAPDSCCRWGSSSRLTHLLHIPTWCAERIWLALLLTAGCWGVVRLCEALGIGNRWARVLAGLAYCAAPLVFTWTTISVACWRWSSSPGCSSPWSPAHGRARPAGPPPARGWRWPSWGAPTRWPSWPCCPWASSGWPPASGAPAGGPCSAGGSSPWPWPASGGSWPRSLSASTGSTTCPTRRPRR